MDPDREQATWQKDSKCRAAGAPALEAFFTPASGPVGRKPAIPSDEEVERRRVLQEVKDFCLGARDGVVCPVREQCLTAGMAEHYGVWGGLDEIERATLRTEIRMRGGRR